MAMMAITTSSSINVKAFGPRFPARWRNVRGAFIWELCIILIRIAKVYSAADFAAGRENQVCRRAVDRLVGHLDDRGEKMIPDRQAAGAKDLSLRAVTVGPANL
jgi:hypothetical protein